MRFVHRYYSIISQRYSTLGTRHYCCACARTCRCTARYRVQWWSRASASSARGCCAHYIYENHLRKPNARILSHLTRPRGYIIIFTRIVSITIRVAVERFTQYSYTCPGPGSRARHRIIFRARSRITTPTYNSRRVTRPRCVVAAAAETTCLNAGFPARAHHAAVPGDGHGLRVRVVPATSGRQRGTPSPRSRRARRRQSCCGRCGRGRVQPFVVRARWLVHAVRQTKPAARRTRVSCVFQNILIFLFHCSRHVLITFYYQWRTTRP